jgi:plasmid stabilization system protein ParE
MRRSSAGRRLPRLAHLTPYVIDWLRRETGYIAQFNPRAARKLVAVIRAARRLLVDHPNIGPPGLISGTRRMVVGTYVLTVRQRNGTPEIIDIRHGRQSDKKE